MGIRSPFVENERLVNGIYVKDVEPITPGGPATPLLMVHGAMHGWWAWEPWLGVFAGSGWHCSALSVRHHTGSRAVPPDEYLRLGASDYVEDILEVVHSTAGPPVLIAHSMGCILAQKVAESVPVAGLILVCGVGPGQLGKLRAPLPLNQTVMRSAEDVRRFFFSEISDEALATYYQRLIPESPGVINNCNDGSLTINASRVSCPVLIVGGEKDAVPLHSPREVAQFYDGDLLMVPDGSHNLMLEAPSLPTAIRIHEWLLQKVDAPALARPTKHSTAT